ncbi:hypothetical protein AX15_002965 [Amanita polypyramis BW_CC]|nr:hypothetical protein AX15_002965 [Amanita polypyramis BW_CC]
MSGKEEHAEEEQYIRAKEQLGATKSQMKPTRVDDGDMPQSDMAKDFEHGFGGQEDLEDRYATTSGEH